MTLQDAFAVQAKACEALGSPFMGQLCRLFAARLAHGGVVADRLLAWPGDVTPGGQSVPLRMAGALHALVLDGVDAGLAAAYPPNSASDDALWAAVTAAFQTHETRLMHWLDSPPQTNEVRRSAAMLTVAAILRKRHDLPLVVSELGASAGLNLSFDRFRMEIGDRGFGAADSNVVLRPDWDGPVPEIAPVEIIDRAGVDVRPIDAGDPKESLRLLAYLWPDQPDRLARTRAAIALSDTAPDTGDAAGWLEARLARPHPGAVHLVYHTIAWQYFPPETQARGEAALARAGALATPEAPLARMSMEADGTPGSAALTLQLWNGSPGSGQILPLGRIDYHGRFLEIVTAEL